MKLKMLSTNHDTGHKKYQQFLEVKGVRIHTL